MSTHVHIKIDERSEVVLHENDIFGVRVVLSDVVDFEFHDTGKGREFARLIIDACNQVDQERRDRAGRAGK